MIEQLLLELGRHANHRGLVLAREERLLAELGGTRTAVSEALRTLESRRTIAVLAPLPFLVVKLLSWSGCSPRATRNEPSGSSLPAGLHRKVPVSSSAAAAAMQSREDGGTGEGEALLGEVLAVLGPEADHAEFRAILARCRPALVRRCLARVQATRRIRVSRAALFRALLHKLSR